MRPPLNRFYSNTFHLQDFYPGNSSTTALVPLLMRWIMHLNGSRLDITTDRLVQTLPGLNYALLRIAAAPILWVMKAADWLPNGGQEQAVSDSNVGKSIDLSTESTLASMLYDRTLFFDQALVVALNSAEQVVILGAGFDSSVQVLPRPRASPV